MQQPYYSLRFFSSSETPLQRHNAQRKLLFEKLHVACENHKALATQKQSLLERLSTVKKQLAQLSREAHEHLNSHNHDHENASIDAHVFSDALEHCAKYKQVIAETQEKIDACEKALNEAFQQKQDLESAINAVQK